MKFNTVAVLLPLSLFTIGLANAATYKVVDLGLDSKGKNSFASKIDANGGVFAEVQELYNPPIDVSLIDFELKVIVDGLTDIDSAKAGNLNLKDLTFLANYVRSNQKNHWFQPLATYQTFLVKQGTTSQITGFDQTPLTQSNKTLVRGTNIAGNYVGISEDPFYKVAYTDKDKKARTYLVNDFLRRGFVQLGDIQVELVPSVNPLGGLSEAYDINDNLQVVGFASYQAADSVATGISNCNDEKKRGDRPVKSCLRTLMQSFDSTNSLRRRATIWQLDDLGNIQNTKELGILFTPASDDKRFYTSSAVAINNAGIAVGSSQFKDDTAIRTYAALFNGDQVTGMTDTKEYYASVATDINDNNLVVGQANKLINGQRRSKFFVHDIAADNTEYPKDFFPGSSSTARDVNNKNQVVGDGEVESTITTTRRREAFIYDHNDKTFTNLNRLIACDSAYTLVRADSINENGQIAATAVTKKARKNIQGEEVKDDAGNVIMDDVTVAVRLDPIAGGTVDDCSAVTPPVERKGGSLLWLIPLGLLITLRRRFTFNQQ